MSPRRRADPRGSGPPGARRRARRDLYWFLGLTALAWIHRVLFLLSNEDRSWPFTAFYEGDSETFYLFARSIIEGRVYDGGIPFHPPAFPFFLAMVHTLTGAGPGAAVVPHLAIKIVMALVGSLQVGLVYLLARPYLGRGLALLAAALCLYHFGLYVVSIAPVTEGFYLTLVLATLLLWSRGLRHPLAAPEPAGTGRPEATGQILPGLALGLLVGLLALTRAEGLLVGLVLWGTGCVGWLRSRRAGRGVSLAPWITTVVGFLVVLTPWTVRNMNHLAEFNRRGADVLAEPLPTFVPITAYGGLNFALANNVLADGSFSRAFLPGEGAVLDLSNREHLALFLHGYSSGLTYIRDHPGGFGRLVLKKWEILFETWKLGWTQWNVPGGLAGLRRPVDVFVPYSAAATWLSVPLAVIGLALLVTGSGPHRRWAVLVVLFTLASTATTALFFGYVRQGALLLPLWMSLVAVGAAWVASRVVTASGALRRLPWIRIAVATVLVLLALEIYGATTNRRYRATGTNVPGTEYLNRDDVMYLEPLGE